MAMTRRAAARLTLGPILYHWPAETKRDFYFRIADEAPLDVVYLGEAVCSKRAPFFDPYIPEVAERLAAAGKQVVYSTLALVMTERELDGVRDLAGTPGLLVEANDVSALPRLAGRPHVIGPFINAYNGDTLRILAGRGAVRVALPNELAAAAIAAIAEGAGGVELEVQVFGRLPLALAARCYHARSRGLAKDGCQYVCGEDDNGLALSTITGSPFLAVNGVQLLSYRMYNLVRELAGLTHAGVTLFRLWPQAIDMVAVARVFRSVLDQRLDGGEAESRLGALVHDIPFANGFYHEREGVAFVAERASE
jgi:collagenase-like PrtC family protease